jgi:hypothetical protein
MRILIVGCWINTVELIGVLGLKTRRGENVHSGIFGPVFDENVKSRAAQQNR